MKLYISAKTNYPDIPLYLNEINFVFESGKMITLDRKQTEYSIKEDGNISMTWREAYIWGGDPNVEQIYLSESDICFAILSALNDAAEVKADIEDEAPYDYTIEILAVASQDDTLNWEKGGNA